MTAWLNNKKQDGNDVMPVKLYLHLVSFWGDCEGRHRGGRRETDTSSALLSACCPASTCTCTGESGGVTCPCSAFLTVTVSFRGQSRWLVTLQVRGQLSLSASWTPKVKLPLTSDPAAPTVSVRASSGPTACRCRTSSWQSGREKGLHWGRGGCSDRFTSVSWAVVFNLVG